MARLGRGSEGCGYRLAWGIRNRNAAIKAEAAWGSHFGAEVQGTRT